MRNPAIQKSQFSFERLKTDIRLLEDNVYEWGIISGLRKPQENIFAPSWTDLNTFITGHRWQWTWMWSGHRRRMLNIRLYNFHSMKPLAAELIFSFVNVLTIETVISLFEHYKMLLMADMYLKDSLTETLESHDRPSTSSILFVLWSPLEAKIELLNLRRIKVLNFVRFFTETWISYHIICVNECFRFSTRKAKLVLFEILLFMTERELRYYNAWRQLEKSINLSPYLRS